MERLVTDTVGYMSRVLTIIRVKPDWTQEEVVEVLRKEYAQMLCNRLNEEFNKRKALRELEKIYPKAERG